MVENNASEEIKKLQAKVKSLSKALLDSYAELIFLYDLGATVTSEFEPKEVILRVLKKTIALVGANRGSLVIFHDGTPSLIENMPQAKMPPEMTFGKDSERDLAYRIFNNLSST